MRGWLKGCLFLNLRKPLLFGCSTVGIIWIDLELLSKRSPTWPVRAQFARKPPKNIWMSGLSSAGLLYLEWTKPVTSETPVPLMRPSLKRRYSMAVAQFNGALLVSFMLKLRKKATWLCRFFPTPGKSWISGTPTCCKSSFGPTPDNKSNCGEFTAPATKTIQVHPHNSIKTITSRNNNLLRGVNNLLLSII